MAEGSKTSSSAPPDATIEATFRNGSLTAISVLLGFSLSFLARWAGLPGSWLPADLVAVVAIGIGILCQIAGTAMLLSPSSLRLARYNRATTLFLVGLSFVAVGVAVVITGDIAGYDQHALRG